ncbi:hypothetical protein ARMGADRAFT_1169848 [Armillaria gallica]|uniref:Uncharacterized protein n=1 Tax=Armillaria gallica TaxID=47427 RepID=A0A2H3D0G9_ARMGA|nr:hypothetical protein ARMGADRAFT_1169848 [Armillaria gallica]
MTTNELLGRGKAARDHDATASPGVPSGEVQCWIVHKSPPSRPIEGDANSPGIETSQPSTESRRGFHFQGIISNVQNASLAPALFYHGIGSKFWDILINVQAVHYGLLIYMRQ